MSYTSERLQLTYGANRKIKLFGISITTRTLERWRKKKLVPLHARTASEQDVFIAESAAAAYLIERARWNDPRIMAARFHMAGCLEGKDSPVAKLDWFWKAGIEGNEEQYVDALNWFFTVIKFLHDMPPNGASAILAVGMPGAGYVYETEPAREDSLSDGKGSIHPREFKPPTGRLVAE